ncbi:EAL and modified HD-GYP domain-containing signal transduction protein [Pelagirhabdus alkalitolerans]|uniref:EAL and modified HD-GYP domain-containing signal transduction protein n=1 Tax=Pelagirhabdus alkalitolerans TaxID=1612202 RepID=A0A1G6M2F3_9BACI|nr:HDOD domain-containing protein [Pelagirhabdus alkalitolerans]SDC49650.1 EAL and modified HD-GYP domain-containing signal transduction protein [Pelagirhabdus alkalitolerans]
MNRVLVAKQPILDRHRQVFAYELLYRSEQPNQVFDGDQATIEVMVNAFLNIGLDRLTGQSDVFVNFTDNLLQEGVIEQFQPDDIVIELLESIQLNERVIKLIKRLATKGYRFALDDVTAELFDEWYEAGLLPHLTYLKIDFLQFTDKQKRKEVVWAVRHQFPHIQLIAEKIETEAMFQEALELGYDFFQGFFFMRPQLMESFEIPSFYYTYIQLIQQIDREEVELTEVASIIQNDLSLAYKLLRLINSPFYRRLERINSIERAVVLLGPKEIKKWLYVLALREHHDYMEVPELNELIVSSYYRAKMSEQLAILLNLNKSQEAFLIGYFSQLPAILRQPLDKLIQELSLDREIEAGLLEEKSELTPIYQLAVAYEQANWCQVDELADQLNFDKQAIIPIYKDAQNWAQSILDDQTHL